MKTYHKNPRQITKKQYADLERWLEELGDLGGIIHDLNSDEVIGGNQRARVFDILRRENAPIVITDEFDPPTRQGTVALGYIDWRGERYGYRQVRWTERQCEQANIVANRAGGEWDFDVLMNEFEMVNLLEWGFERWELGIVDDIDYDELWQGMPEFEQGDESPFRSIKIHFENQESINEFSAMIGQIITEKTKYIWYPYKPPANLKSQDYVSES